MQRARIENKEDESKFAKDRETGCRYSPSHSISMLFASRRPGFTLLELLVAIAVIVILALVVASGIGSFRESAALDQAVDDTLELLRQARARTLASENALGYGVHFASTSVTMFSGGTFVSGNAGNSVINLPTPVRISSIALGTTTGNILFERLSGSTKATGTVDFITARTGRTKRILILSSGVSAKQ